MRFFKALIVLLLLHTTSLAASNTAVFLIYHRVGDSTYPTTNVSQAQFAQEMDWLATQHYQVWPPEKILNYLQHNQSLPDKTIGITFDDAYQSMYDNAWPILRKYHFPFALFVATGPIDQHVKDMMTWAEISELAKQGVEIGNHSVNHPHLAAASKAKIQQEVSQAQQRLQQVLGTAPHLFAYPFGEYSQAFVSVVKQFGFVGAFTQVSGAVDSQSDFTLLPRFPLNEHYSDFERFKVILSMQSLQIAALQPADTVVSRTPHSVQFTVLTTGLNLKQLQCYSSTNDSIKINTQQLPQVQLTLTKPFGKGRTRINCTAKDAQGHWHWLGLLYIM